MGHRDNYRAKQLRSVHLEDATDQLKHCPGLGGGSGDTRVIGKFRAGFPQQTHQQVSALGTGQVLEVWNHIKGAQDLTE